MEGFNSFEYSAEQRCEGKWILYKILLIFAYIAFAAVYFTVIFITKLIPLGALIPFFLWVLVFLPWRFLSPDYQYIIEGGVFSFYINYSNKKKTKKAKTSFKISDASHILASEASEDAVRKFKPSKVFYGIPSKSTADIYVILYTDADGKRCAVYFAAMPDAIRLLKIYNPKAMKNEQH